MIDKKRRTQKDGIIYFTNLTTPTPATPKRKESRREL